MAVLQISRIQLRRGKKNEASGLPQLASGEMAWAIDSQELYIGNGAVSEGAPAVGNTRILTEADNILDLADEYQYKINNSLIQTNTDVNFPVVRTLQDRLDDFVTSNDYGIHADGTDQTAKIQNAITNLFVTAGSRVVLKFQPGIFKITSTIHIPSYATIEGAGLGKTVFSFEGTGDVFAFDKDPDGHTIEYINQPRYISMKGFTVNTNNIATRVFNMYSVRDSVLEDIDITGMWTTSSNSLDTSISIGIGMYAFGFMVTCQKNKFIRVSVDSFRTAIYAKQDIFNNLIDNCSFKNAETGVKFGVGTGYGATGFQYGPRKNIIKNSRFEDVNQYGIIVDNGYGNRSRSNTFINVGNDGSGNSYPELQDKYSIIKFVNPGNSSTQDIFDRAIDLASSGYGTNPYLAEVEGAVSFTAPETRVVSIGQSASPTQAFRIPINSSTGVSIQYLYRSTAFTQMRKGTLSVTIDQTHSNLQLVDEYDYTGTIGDGRGDDVKLVFSVQIENIDGYNSLVVKYINSNVADVATLTYSYTILS
jgi:hypothetical protein